MLVLPQEFLRKTKLSVNEMVLEGRFFGFWEILWLNSACIQVLESKLFGRLGLL